MTKLMKVPKKKVKVDRFAMIEAVLGCPDFLYQPLWKVGLGNR